MLKRFFAFIPISSFIAFLINNFVLDAGDKIWWFILFGVLFFGITWSIRKIDELLTGVYFGAIAGVLITIIVTFAEENLLGASFYGANLLYVTCKWIIPIVFYSGGASFPWKE